MLEAVSIIPPQIDPGDFVVTPESIKQLSDADFLIIHDWQAEKFSASVINSVNNSKLRVAAISLDGEWMIPEIQSKATDKILSILKSLDGKNSAVYEAEAASYQNKIKNREQYIREQIAPDKFNVNLSTVNVISSEKAATFVSWLGLNVVSTYGKPETMTVEKRQELINLGRNTGIRIVTDSIQDGTNTGGELSEKLGAHRATISDYPGGADYTANWEDSVVHNMRVIIGVLHECG